MENNLTHCENLNFIPCNFNEQSPVKEVIKSGASSSKKTLVLLEGITYFLSPEVIDNLLSELKKSFSNTLQITLDYAYEDYIKGDLNYYGAK